MLGGLLWVSWLSSARLSLGRLSPLAGPFFVLVALSACSVLEEQQAGPQAAFYDIERAYTKAQLEVLKAQSHKRLNLKQEARIAALFDDYEMARANALGLIRSGGKLSSIEVPVYRQRLASMHDAVAALRHLTNNL
jgi:hypothetical protein